MGQTIGSLPHRLPALGPLCRFPLPSSVRLQLIACRVILRHRLGSKYCRCRLALATVLAPHRENAILLNRLFAVLALPLCLSALVSINCLVIEELRQSLWAKYLNSLLEIELPYFNNQLFVQYSLKRSAKYN